MKKIGYQFNTESLLEIALTHRSIQRNNNERLEFLGDAVLNFVIGEILYKTFPHAPEGHLSRLRSTLVNEDSLAEIAKSFELGEKLKLGAGELKSGGMRRKSILADALEAIIGAIYLDSDMNQCQKIILQWFSHRLENMDKVETLKDAKSRLQEYVQSHQLSLPSYTIVSITGKAHAQHFYVACEVSGLPHRAEGEGSSRREAEQMAATAYLALISNTIG